MLLISPWVFAEDIHDHSSHDHEFVFHPYELTSQDVFIISRVSQRIDSVIRDRQNGVDANAVISYIETIPTRRELWERENALLANVAQGVAVKYWVSLEWKNIPKVPEIIVQEIMEEQLSETSMRELEVVSVLDETIIASYRISGDTIVLLEWTSQARYLEVWEDFTQIIPKYAREDLRKFQVFSSTDSPTWAYVRRDQENSELWNITINIDAFNDNSQIILLIHEFAHILTLNREEVVYFIPGDRVTNTRVLRGCRTNIIPEGCLGTDSYLHAFITNFWVDLLDARRQDPSFNFYAGNEDDFVGSYAATNPWEDIAESFTHFILRQKPLSTTVADKKINFFYQYPELVELRRKIRINIINQD